MTLQRLLWQTMLLKCYCNWLPGASGVPHSTMFQRWRKCLHTDPDFQRTTDCLPAALIQTNLHGRYGEKARLGVFPAHCAEPGEQLLGVLVCPDRATSFFSVVPGDSQMSSPITSQG